MMRKFLAVLLVVAISAPAVRADILPPPKKKDAGAAAESRAPWWDEQTAGWLGGLIGGSVGILGAVYGIMAGLGVARRFVLTATLVSACVGAVVLLAGIGAVLSGQPYHVYFLPLLIGGIMAMVFGMNYPIIKRRNEQMELQQMRALDS